MQLGRLEEMDQARVNHIEQINKVKNINEQDKILPDERYKDQQESKNKNIKNEVLLDNVKFGFNKKTKEFFVRVSKNGLEYQFPTEQIMKIKEHLKDTLNEI